jgi:xanthine phosphoribosyltransferase
MQALKDRILRDGKNLGDGILKVDGFINHQVDPELMNACGKQFAEQFKALGATKILTAEISGIAPALTTALHLGLPVVYARKNKPITIGRTVELIVSPEYLTAKEKVLIIDDFLASGATILGLARLAQTAGAQIVGIGALVEKTFEKGREALSSLGVPIVSLVAIARMEGTTIEFQTSAGQ